MRSLLAPSVVHPDAIPESDLPWLEELRVRHVAACAELKAATDAAGKLPARQREALAAWRTELSDLAAAGEDPPMVPARFEAAWQAGEIARAEAQADAAAASLVAVWAALEDAVGSEHCATAGVQARRAELAERALERDVDSGPIPSIARGIKETETVRASRMAGVLLAAHQAAGLRRYVAQRPWASPLDQARAA